MFPTGGEEKKKESVLKLKKKRERRKDPGEKLAGKEAHCTIDRSKGFLQLQTLGVIRH